MSRWQQESFEADMAQEVKAQRREDDTAMLDRVARSDRLEEAIESEEVKIRKGPRTR